MFSDRAEMSKASEATNETTGTTGRADAYRCKA